MARRQYYQYQSTATLPGGTVSGQPPQPTLMTVPVEPPSAFRAAASVSGSMVIVGGVVSLAYGVDYALVLPFVLAPWAIFAIGKGIYLVLLLITDITALFDGDPATNPRLLPILKDQ